MANHNEQQFFINVESYLPEGMENTRKNVQLRPARGEAYSQGVRISCKRGPSENHPVGTIFRITVQTQDDQNGLGEYLVMPESFPYEVVDQPK